MTTKPNRAKMCNWVSNELRHIRTIPNNPMDIQRLAENARVNDKKVSRLADIVMEMGWHVESSLDVAQQLIDEYKDEFAPDLVVPV